ncbi:MAG: hypothetical protein ACI84K_001188 [Pseudohongiellaceae bacterium]|jgi:hypothetical protein
MEFTMTTYLTRIANLALPHLKLSILSALVLNLIACQTPRLEVHSKAVSLSTFKHYETYHVASLNNPDMAIIPIVNTAIANELNIKGYTQTDANSADIIIKYKIKIKHGKQLRIDAIPVDNNVYSRPTTEALNEASMLVNVTDTVTNKVVWKASTVRNLNTVNVKIPIEKRAKVSMSEIFEDFPTK